MKLLRIKVNNYRNCEENLEISFLPISKKTEEDKTYELNLIDDELYLLNTTAIIGKNASGKTSIIHLIKNVYQILGSFQLDDELLTIHNTEIEILFHHNHKIYNYYTKLIKNNNLGNNLSFTDEKITYSEYFKSYNKKISNLKMKELKINKELPDDISILYYILKNRNNYAYYYDDLNDNKLIYHNLYNKYLEGNIDKKYWKHLLHLFDENIINLTEINNNIFKLEYKNKIVELSAKELFYMLSSGTTKGLILYTSAIQALIGGNTLIIDEIENHFHKTLVEYIISLFKDKTVNKKNANLIFTTHYCELLDLFGRSDNIWIAKSNEKVQLTNLYLDYSMRNDLLKSKKFYNDNFGTAVSYELLMDMKYMLRL